MSEPTEHPYRGMSEGFAGDWLGETGHAAPRPVPPVPPPAPAAPGAVPSVPAETGLTRPENLDEGSRAVGDKLSALLQNAVDEQVQEQRHLVSLMADIQNGLARRTSNNADEVRKVVQTVVGGAVTELSENFHTGMQTLREQHDAQIAEISQRLADAQTELRDLRQNAVAPPEDSYQDGPSVEDLLDGMAGMRTELRVLPEQMAPFVAGALAPSIADLGRTLSTLEAAQQATSQDTATVHAELAALLPRLENMPEQIATLGAQLASLTASQAALASVAPVAAGPDAHEIADIVRKGVRDATRDFVRDYLRDAVRDIVTVSTRDTERRITDHVDEAILALAQALLTRRPAITTTEYVVVPDPAPSVVGTEEPVSEPEPVLAAAPTEDLPGATFFEPAKAEESSEDAPTDVDEAPAADSETVEPAFDTATESAGEALASETPASETPASETPAVEAPAGEAPATHRRRGLFRRR